MKISSYRYLAYLFFMFIVVMFALAVNLTFLWPLAYQFFEIVGISDTLESVFELLFVGIVLYLSFAFSVVFVLEITLRGFLIVCYKLSRRGSIYLGEVFFDSSMPSLANLEHAIEINSFLPKSWSKAVFESLKRVGIV
jgi:hypothetical protein